MLHFRFAITIQIIVVLLVIIIIIIFWRLPSQFDNDGKAIALFPIDTLIVAMAPELFGVVCACVCVGVSVGRVIISYMTNDANRIPR